MSIKKLIFLTEADIDLQVTWTAQNNTAVGKFSNWVVTMPDGSKYTFAGLVLRVVLRLKPML
jgi:hypothetical protein